MEITSRYAGKITKLHIAVGEMAQVGGVLLEIDNGESSSAQEAAPVAAAATAPAAATASTPASSGTFPLALSQRSLLSERFAHLYICRTRLGNVASGKVLTTPAVRRIAKENNIDLSSMVGTGPQGRILKGDVLAYLEGGAPVPAAAVPAIVTSTPAAPPAVSMPSLAGTVEPIRGIKRAMFNKMNVALTIPAFGFCDEISVLKAGEVRKRFKPRAVERGFGFSYMPLFIKAASLALKEHPILNSSISSDGNDILYHASPSIFGTVQTDVWRISPH